MIKKQTNKTCQKSKSKNRRKLPQHNKGTYEKPRANIIFNEERLKSFP